MRQAKQAIETGFYLGIGGVVTYKNAGMAKVVAEIPLDHLVLETDAPYLTPVPHRGKRNESSYLFFVAEKIAEIKGISREEVDSITTENAKKIFKV
jgi:TatD DNase family protein